MRRKYGFIAGLAATAMIMASGLFVSSAQAASTWESLTDQEKMSSYGFFVYQAEHAASTDRRASAQRAADILKNQSLDHADLTHIGGTNDSTTLANFKSAAKYVGDVNAYRSGLVNEPCRTDLPADGGRVCDDSSLTLTPLQINDEVMAVSQVNANYSATVIGHAGNGVSGFGAGAENAAWNYSLYNTWSYENCKAGDPNAACQWYTREKPYYECIFRDKKTPEECKALTRQETYGHYTSISNKAGNRFMQYTITGFGISTNPVKFPITFVQNYYTGRNNVTIDPAQYLKEIESYEQVVRQDLLKITSLQVNPTAVTVPSNNAATDINAALAGVKVTATYSDNSTAEVTPQWTALTDAQKQTLQSKQGGTFTVTGTVNGKFEANVSNTISIHVTVSPATKVSAEPQTHEVTVDSGTNPATQLNAIQATVKWSNGDTTTENVKWAPIAQSDYSKREGGDITATGTIDGLAPSVQATVHVTPATITEISDASATTLVNKSVDLQSELPSVTVAWSNGEQTTEPVTWKPVDASAFDTVHDVAISGTLTHYADKAVSGTIHVVAAQVTSLDALAGVTVDAGKDVSALLPSEVKATLTNNKTTQLGINWDKLTTAQLAVLTSREGGAFDLQGNVPASYDNGDTARRVTVHVTVKPATVTKVVYAGITPESTITTIAGVAAGTSQDELVAKLPAKALVYWSNAADSTTEESIPWGTLSSDNAAILAGRAGGSFAHTANVHGTALTAHVVVDPATVSHVATLGPLQTTIQTVPTLPQTVQVTWSNGEQTDEAITWPALTADQFAARSDGQEVQGTIFTGTDSQQTVSVTVRVVAQVLTPLDSVQVTTESGTAPDLPKTVEVRWSDGVTEQRPVMWQTPTQDQYSTFEASDFTVQGYVEFPAGTLTQSATAARLLRANMLRTAESPMVLAAESDGVRVPVVANVHVNAAHFTSFTNANAEYKVEQGSVNDTDELVSSVLPSTVSVTYSNGLARDEAVTWDAQDLEKIDLNTLGEYIIHGSVDDSITSDQVQATVVVVEKVQLSTGATTTPSQQANHQPASNSANTQSKQVEPKAGAQSHKSSSLARTGAAVGVLTMVMLASAGAGVVLIMRKHQIAHHAQ